MKANTNRANVITSARTEESEEFSTYSKMLDTVGIMSHITEIMFVDFMELDNSPLGVIQLSCILVGIHIGYAFYFLNMHLCSSHRGRECYVKHRKHRSYNHDSYITEKRGEKRKIEKISAKKRIHRII